MNNYYKLLKILCITSLILPLFAQETEDEQEGLEIVVTTATKTEKDILDTSQAVTALSGNQLLELGLNNIRDLNNMIPGLYVQNTDTNAPIITLRGIRTENVTELGDPAVGIHVDGVYVARPQAANALMFDLERTELTRGPQGTLYGRNSVVGTLNIVTAKPNFDIQGGSLNLLGGQLSEAGLRAHYNLPINEKLALRFAYMEQSKDSFLDGFWDGSQLDWRRLPSNVRDQFEVITSPDQRSYLSDYAWYLGCSTLPGNGCGQGNFSDPYNKIAADPSEFYTAIEDSAWRISATYVVDDNSDLNIQFENYEDNGKGWTNVLSCELMRTRTGITAKDGPANTCTDILGSENRYQSFANTPGFNKMNIDSFRAIYKRQLNETTNLTVNYGYQELEQSSQFEIDGGVNYQYGMAFNINRLLTESNVLDAYITGANQEWAWVGGIFTSTEDNDMLANFTAELNGHDFFWQPNRELNHYAVYGQATYALRDDLFFTVGGRLSYDEKSDVGGRNINCNSANGCYPQIYNTGGNPFDVINQLAPDYWIQMGKMIDGVDCVAPMIGCGVVVTNNDTSQSWDNFSWRLGLDWDMNDTSFMYAYLATAYKSGSLADVYVAPSNSILYSEGQRVDLNYDPEYVTTGEWGIKARNDENTLNYAFNAFYTVYDGKQFTGNLPVDVVEVYGYDSDPNSPTFGQFTYFDQGVTLWTTENFGEQTHWGLEFEYNWLPYDGGKLSGFVTSYHTEFTEDFITMWRYGQDALFGRDYGASIDPTNPNNFVNLKGNEAPYTPDLAFTIRFEHTYRLQNGMEFKPGMNYHWESSSYVTPWNMDKHVNDEGGCIGPNYFCQPVENYTDKRDRWEIYDYFLTLDSKQNWYIQWASYNAKSEIVPWSLGIEAGIPRGAYSAPSQKVIRFGYYW
tara:strand:+ start:258 stop:2984 length:2727 start_codon:yes stop_codon:yes gene_type:complete